MNVTVRGRSVREVDALVGRCAAAGVRLFPDTPYRHRGPREAGISESGIGEGVRRLGREPRAG